MSSIAASVEFFVNEKVKSVEIHPHKSLILTFDRNEGKICCWDYMQKKNILNTTLANLFYDGNSYSSGLVNEIHNHGIRLSKTHTCKYNGTISDEDLKCNTSAVKNVQITNKMKQDVGLISQVTFADCSYIKYTNGLLINSIKHHSNSDNLIVIVSDQVVFFYDYVLKLSNVIYLADIHKASNSTKSQPTCVEQVYFNVCLIGNSDGTICLWDFTNNETDPHIRSSRNVSSRNILNSPSPPKGSFVDIQFLTGNKCEIVIIKSIPIKCVDDNKSNENKNLIRFMTVAIDGQALIWELDVNTIQSSNGVGVINSKNGSLHNITILPIAKLDASILCSNLSKSSIIYDKVLDHLHIACSEKKIRVWDLDELKLRNRLQRSLSKNSKSVNMKPTAVKRTSILSLSSVSQSQNDILADVYVLNSIEIVKINSLSSQFLKINSFTMLKLSHDIYSCCYVTSARTNGFAVWYDHNSQHDDDNNSDASSAIGNKHDKDKTNVLLLNQEFSLQSIMNSYFNDLSHSKESIPAIPDAILDTSKVYSMHSCPAFPNLLIISTSLGALVLSMRELQVSSGSIHGTHPKWGITRFIYDKISTKRVLLQVDSTTLDITTDSVSDCNPFFDLKNSLNHPNSPPSFHPSPSGRFCSIVWPHHRIYIIYSISSPTLVIEKGYCSEFGWIGSDDHFLIKAIQSNSIIAKPTKKMSIKNMLFKTSKINEEEEKTQLVLKKIEETKVVTLRLAELSTIKSLNICSNLQVAHLNVELIDTIFSGVLISINSKDKKDLDHTTRYYNNFYTLVTTKWLKNQLQYELSSSNNKDKGKKQRKSSAIIQTMEESSLLDIKPSDEEEFLFMIIGSRMKPVEMIRWDYKNGFCAMVLQGSSQINILCLHTTTVVVNGKDNERLTSTRNVVDFQTIGSVNLDIPRCLNISIFYDLTWINGILYYSCDLNEILKVIFCCVHSSDNNIDAYSSHPTKALIDVVEVTNDNHTFPCISAIVGFDAMHNILLLLSRTKDVISFLITKNNPRLAATFLIHSGYSRCDKDNVIDNLRLQNNDIITESLKWISIIDDVTQKEQIARSLVYRNMISIINDQTDEYELGDDIASYELKLKSLLLNKLE